MQTPQAFTNPLPCNWQLVTPLVQKALGTLTPLNPGLPLRSTMASLGGKDPGRGAVRLLDARWSSVRAGKERIGSGPDREVLDKESTWRDEVRVWEALVSVVSEVERSWELTILRSVLLSGHVENTRTRLTHSV